MDTVLIAFALGFALATMLFGMAWYNARQRAREMEEVLNRLAASLKDVLGDGRGG